MFLWNNIFLIWNYKSNIKQNCSIMGDGMHVHIIVMFIIMSKLNWEYNICLNEYSSQC